jgi:uncharacterized protein
MSTATPIDGFVAGRTLPVVDQDNRRFFEAAARGELVLQRCKETGLFQHYPRACSIYTCGEIEWVVVPGRGKVYTYTIVHQNASDAAFAKLVPYAIGIIELAEGVRLMGNIVGCALDDLRVDMPVQVYFSPIDEAREIHLPFWRPVP